MITFYTCTQVTPEVYAAYKQYSPSKVLYTSQELQAVTLCVNDAGITIYPVLPPLNTRHLREFGSTDPQSVEGDINTLVNVEEFLRQLFILELEQ